MTTAKLIQLVQELSPTERSDEMLTQWIEECENYVLINVMLVSPEDCVTLSAGDDVTLAVPKPWDKLYLPYVQAKIAFYQGEIGRYENYLAMFEAYMDEYARHICQTVYPAGGEAKLKGYYLSAYAMAVEKGYQGSEADWLASLKGAKGDPGVQGIRGPAGPSIPVEWAMYDGKTNRYRVTDAELPPVVPGSQDKWVGKGQQMIFIPQDAPAADRPLVSVNDGVEVEIRKRSAAGLTEELKKDELKAGVPYTLTFCGLYWLVDNSIFTRQDVVTLIAAQVAGMITMVNGKAGINGAVTLDSDEIYMADGLSGWEGYTVTEAVEEVVNRIPTEVIINNLIAEVIKAYVKTVNGVTPGEDGNVLLESDNIQMSDGEYGWAGYNVTQALEEVNSSIPHKAVIDGYIDAKIKELPPCVKDVKINSTSVVTKEEASISLSGALQFVSRILGITPTTEENITQRVQTRALTLNKLDSAVKAALCDGTGAAWSEAEQAAARERIGIKSVEGVLF